jgi:hypothetical protein
MQHSCSTVCGCEGIVSKRLGSRYVFGQESGRLKGHGTGKKAAERFIPDALAAIDTWRAKQPGIAVTRWLQHPAILHIGANPGISAPNTLESRAFNAHHEQRRLLAPYFG